MAGSDSHGSSGRSCKHRDYMSQSHITATMITMLINISID